MTLKRTSTVGILMAVSIAAGVTIGAAIGPAGALANPEGSITANHNESSGRPAAAAASVPSAHVFALAANGKSYGSELDAASPDDAPDLILAIATNGNEGYVLKSDLYPSGVRGGAARNAGSARVIPVYDVTGVKVIGSFEISPPGPVTGK